MSHGNPKRRRRLTLGAGLAGLLVLWACEGRNLFQPVDVRAQDRRPPTVEIEQPREPAARPIGDSVLVRVRVADDSGVDSVLLGGVALRGDPEIGRAHV